MSGSDDTESQCDRTSETNGLTMGDVLAKESNDNDSHDDSIESDDEQVDQDQRQEADGAPDALDAVPENFLFQPPQMVSPFLPMSILSPHAAQFSSIFCYA